MPNIIDADGLTLATQAELQTQFTADFQSIYGADINLDQDSPDGQLMNIFIQAVLDVEDLVQQVFNMFDPDNAIGVILDQRVAINGIQRLNGSRSVTDITLVADQSLNLYGVDQTDQDVFTISDNAGTLWQLQTTQLGVAAGSHVYAFQAALVGATLTTPNTITVPVTIVLGVVSVNNPTTASTIGINEETDAALKIRRQKSVSLASKGYLAGLLAALLNITGVSSAAVYENNSSTTDADGIPDHSIWVVVGGAPAAADVANAIYTKRNAGCGLFGSTTYLITTAQGLPFQVRWDYTSSEALFITFTASPLDGITPVNIAAILTQLPLKFIPGVNQEVNINALATLVQQIDPNCLVTGAGFSTTLNGIYSAILTPSSKTKFFAVSAPNIIIYPMIMSPSQATVVRSTSLQFTALGGHGTITWSLSANLSGGSVNSSGLYTAGATPNVTDVVVATDDQGQFVTAPVSVT